MKKRGPEIIRMLGRLQRENSDPSLWIFKSPAAAHQYLRIFNLITRWIPAGSRVLDWGSGNGHFSFFLASMDYDVTAYSFEVPNLLKTLESMAYRFQQAETGEPVRLPFHDGSFHAVCSVGVLEHVRETGGNEAGSLREICRILDPGGYFLCFHLPNRYGWIEALASFFPRRHRHRFRYRRKDILRLSMQAGFVVRSVKRYGILPRNFWASTPGRIRNSVIVAAVWDLLDEVLGFLFNPLCQNYFFIAEKSGLTGNGCVRKAGAGSSSAPKSLPARLPPL